MRSHRDHFSVLAKPHGRKSRRSKSNFECTANLCCAPDLRVTWMKSLVLSTNLWFTVIGFFPVRCEHLDPSAI